MHALGGLGIAARVIKIPARSAGGVGLCSAVWLGLVWLGVQEWFLLSLESGLPVNVDLRRLVQDRTWLSAGNQMQIFVTVCTLRCTAGSQTVSYMQLP